MVATTEKAPHENQTRASHQAEKRRAPGGEQAPPYLTPLDFVLRIMRDETKPAALRAGMAKAAMPYLHRRGGGDAPPEDEPEEPPRSPPRSDLELAGRIAHILSRAQMPAGNPVEKPANAGHDGTQGGAVGAKTF